MSHDDIARQFVQFYYSAFDSDRNRLRDLYGQDSWLSFEGAKVKGQNEIIAKLVSLPFTNPQHRIDTVDAQACPNNGILVFVSGALITEGESHPQRFSQIFNLQPLPGSNSFFIFNDMFRLNYG